MISVSCESLERLPVPLSGDEVSFLSQDKDGLRRCEALPARLPIRQAGRAGGPAMTNDTF